MRKAWWALGAIALLLLLPSAAGAGSPGHYLPVAGNKFVYTETITVNHGVGDYTGYTDIGFYNGSIAVTAVQPNGTESAVYASAGRYQNSLGQAYPWSEGGTFTFSAVSYHYVQGTDNQTGYVDPYVWFYMNNSLGRGATFFLLNTPMTVVGTDVPFPMAASPTGYVATIFAEGNGSYQRADDYGNFTADYNWKAYFDPGTGYIVGYTYSEVDSNASGDGFTYTDVLTDTSTSFPLSSVAAPAPPSTAAAASLLPWITLAVVVVVVVLLVVFFAVRRRSPALPRHPSASGTMPAYAPPPPIYLVPRDQPAVQQVVVREVVKVPCRFCGTLIESTVTNCPNCGAPRT